MSQVVLIEGRFSGILPLCSRNEPVFISWCTPIAMPETRESVVQGATNIFTSTHTMDFKIASIDEKSVHACFTYIVEINEFERGVDIAIEFLRLQ